MTTAAEPYPLTFEPILKAKVWGGRRLARLHKPLPPNAAVGESWEIADLASTSPTGGGGDAARSVIARGPLAGRTLHDAMRAWGEALLGRVRPTPDGGFPLLVKFLDAREHLSVQVHPSPAYARARPDAHLKTECWYVIDAAPGSVIFKGLRPGIGLPELKQAIEAGRVPDVLDSVEAVAGECHNLPSGTIHALGAGVLVAEVQTPSDTTFRLYDWNAEYDRPPRAMHVAESLESALLEPPPAATSRREGERGPVRLVETDYFTVEEARAGEDSGPGGDGPIILMTIRGEGRAVSGRGAYEPVELAAGETVLIPAACAQRIAFEGCGDLRVLLARVVGR